VQSECEIQSRAFRARSRPHDLTCLRTGRATRESLAARETSDFLRGKRPFPKPRFVDPVEGYQRLERIDATTSEIRDSSNGALVDSMSINLALGEPGRRLRASLEAIHLRGLRRGLAIEVRDVSSK